MSAEGGKVVTLLVEFTVSTGKVIPMFYVYCYIMPLSTTSMYSVRKTLMKCRNNPGRSYSFVEN